jgi:phosphoribosyl 1,2-cyclic phosphate phosphodiesterase
MNKITLLGNGTSTGVPILGCNCEVCQSRDVRNKRTRTSALIETSNGKNILIDTSPDLRAQLLKRKISHIHEVIITHDHADHTHGIDDLRPYTFKSIHPIPVFTSADTQQSLTKKFPYIFDQENYFSNKEVLGGGIPKLKLCPVNLGVNKIGEENFIFFSLPHGHQQTLGFVHGKMGYFTDINYISADVLTELRQMNLELLFIDCLRPMPHQTHLHFERSLEYIQAVNPRLSVLIHLGHEWDYLELCSELRRRNVKNTLPGIDHTSFLYS